MRRVLRSAVLVLLAAGAGRAEDLGRNATQKLSEKGDTLRAEYGFENFNNDRLALSFQLKKSAYQAFDAEWGYTAAELDALKAWLNKARQDALKTAESQAQLDAAVKRLQSQYKKKLSEYLALRGFLLGEDNSVRVDMPALVRRNVAVVKPLAEDLDAVAKKKGYDSPDTIGAATAMMQTALAYRQPPPLMEGKHTGGVLPPPVALLKGWGDCDTKTALLASVLKNYSSARLVGIAVPGHYLLGVLAQPQKGDMFVEFDGQRYVLIEPAGPAWLPPGTVGEETKDMLGNNDYKIEPFN